MRGLAEEANLEEPEKFAQAWHMLMEGSIVSAGEGNRNAARDAKCAAQLEHVPPELNGRILTAFWIGDFTGIDSPLGGGRCRLPILLIFEVG